MGYGGVYRGSKCNREFISQFGGQEGELSGTTYRAGQKPASLFSNTSNVFVKRSAIKANLYICVWFEKYLTNKKY